MHFKMLSTLTKHSKNVGIQGFKLFSSNSSPSVTVIYSWGNGTEGQLGHAKFDKETGVTGAEYFQEEPRKLVKSKRFVEVAAGENYSLGLTKTGEVFGWGSKKVFDKTENVKEPMMIDMNVKIKQIAAGPKHMAVIDVNGLVHTWGYGGGFIRGGGQLGHGNRDDLKEPTLVRAFQDYGAKAASVSCGRHHTLILTDDGEMLTFGVGEYGRLGTGSSSDSHIPMPIDSLGDVDIVQIAAGCDHSLALTANGTILSWGRNQSGQLGHLDSNLDIYSMENLPRAIDADSIAGNNSHESGPTMVKFAQVAAGTNRSAAISTDGQLYVWGVRMSNAPKVVNKELLDDLRVIKVACGGDSGHSVIAIITEDGGLWTMGDKGSKMLGIQDAKNHPIPKRVEVLKGKRVVDVKCGPGRHMFAFVADEE